MATLTNNGLFAGVSGRIGDIVVRQCKGRTIICNRPKKSSVAPTAGQQKTRILFKQAAEYAKQVLKDPDRKQAYVQKLKKEQGSLYVAILTDYLKEKKESEREQISTTRTLKGGGRLRRIHGKDGILTNPH